ncbi:hypothetical protein L6469_12830 [Segatella baroniae B14]|uniref:hypothetical protein n=1 Tax=Segatella baroniae TaxID=305719 RepID=UPI001EDAABC0|nr:hypothetical protein [Segatella baroniae]UKK79243.1 hypothetical protein L6469_12830 [Segatella baroniae B14]
MQEKYLGQKKFSQSTQRRKDIKEFEVYKKEILLNSSRTKKTWRLCVLGVRFYINYSVTCLFDATMPEKYLGQKKSRKERKDAKILKSMKPIKKIL